jgi:hypothetical protein
MSLSLVLISQAVKDNINTVSNRRQMLLIAVEPVRSVSLCGLKFVCTVVMASFPYGSFQEALGFTVKPGQREYDVNSLITIDEGQNGYHDERKRRNQTEPRSSGKISGRLS